MRRPHHRPANPFRPMRKVRQAQPLARRVRRLGARILPRSRDRRSVRRVFWQGHVWFLSSADSSNLYLFTKPALLICRVWIYSSSGLPVKLFRAEFAEFEQRLVNLCLAIALFT